MCHKTERILKRHPFEFLWPKNTTCSISSFIWNRLIIHVTGVPSHCNSKPTCIIITCLSYTHFAEALSHVAGLCYIFGICLFVILSVHLIKLNLFCVGFCNVEMISKNKTGNVFILCDYERNSASQYEKREEYYEKWRRKSSHPSCLSFIHSLFSGNSCSVTSFLIVGASLTWVEKT